MNARFLVTAIDPCRPWARRQAHGARRSPRPGGADRARSTRRRGPRTSRTISTVTMVTRTKSAEVLADGTMMMVTLRPRQIRRCAVHRVGAEAADPSGEAGEGFTVSTRKPPTRQDPRSRERFVDLLRLVSLAWLGQRDLEPGTRGVQEQPVVRTRRGGDSARARRPGARRAPRLGTSPAARRQLNRRRSASLTYLAQAPLS